MSCALFVLPTLGQMSDNNVEIDSGSTYDGPERGLREFGRNAFHYAWRRESFLNYNFFQAMQEGVLEKSPLNLEMSFSHILFYPLALEATGFYSSYKAPTLSDDDDTYVGHTGIEFYVDAFVLPYIGRISDFLAPYVGVGYQTSQLYWGEKSTAGTGSAIIKMGTRLYLSRTLFLVEYKQTLPTNTGKQFSALSFGMGFNF